MVNTINHVKSHDVVSHKKISTAKAFVLMLQLVRPHARQLTLALVALTIGSGINLLFPELVRRVLEPDVSQEILQNMHVYVAGAVVLFLFQGASFFVRSYYFGVLCQRVYADLRHRLFGALIRKSVAFYDDQRASDVASRLNSDAALIQDAVSVKLSVLLRYGLQVVCGVVLMSLMSWQLTMAIVGSIGFMVLISGVFVSRLKSASRAYQHELGLFTSYASECFSGIKSIRVLGAEEQVCVRADLRNQDTLMAGERRVAWSSSFSSGASAALNVLLLFVAWYGVSLVQGASLALNELAAFVLYGGLVAVSFSFFTGAYAEVMQAIGGLERVFEILSDEREVDGRDAKLDCTERQVEIADSSDLTVSMEAVSFAYPSRPDVLALKEFSCVFSANSCTALVGPSGSGKSSVAQLLVGLYRPLQGAVTLGGAKLTELNNTVLHEMISWVPQEPRLFGFTVLENLLLGNDLLLRDEALKLIQRWQFLDFIETLSEGVDTVLGEHGTLLSGGQRQRIAIAQAMLRKPRMLILDEATSGLDSDTEQLVMKAVRESLPNTTILVISHRLATVRIADVIHVMNEGRVIESGTHEELASRSGLYQSYSSKQALG